MAELASQPTSVQTVYTWYRDGKLLVNRRYQRKLVWTLEEKQKLIESLLKKYPVPAILLAERDSPGTYEIIDGLQRLHSIVSFIENAFPLADGKYFNVDQFPTAKAAADEGRFEKAKDAALIGSKEVSILLDYSLALSVMRNTTDSEVNDVFDRITLRDSVLSNMDFNSFYGLGLIAITVPPQQEPSYVDEQIYWRNGDSTEVATSAKQIAGIAARFGTSS
jgi:hypothetical protein